MSVDKAPSDSDRALTLASIIGRVGLTGEERMVMVTIPGNPPSKKRARFSRRGHAYSDPDMVRSEERTATYVQDGIRGRLFTGNVAVGCIFFRADMYRQDVDNMLKHICDAANGVAWVDDCQVTAILGMAEYDPDNPRTILVITSHESTLRRGTDDVVVCKGCDNLIERRVKRLFCSDECAKRTPRGVLAKPIKCPGCGELFRRFTSGQKFCSRGCVPRLGGTRPSTANRSKCADCNKELAHNRGGRCRDCWRKNPKRREP